MQPLRGVRVASLHKSDKTVNTEGRSRCAAGSSPAPLFLHATRNFIHDTLLEEQISGFKPARVLLRFRGSYPLTEIYTRNLVSRTQPQKEGGRIVA
jgi:hypothetical protein